MSAQPAKSRLALKAILVLAVLVAAGAVILNFLRPTARVVVIERGHATDGRPGSVAVVPEYDLAIKTEVPGRVVSSAIEVGKVFQEGDVLAQLDTGTIDISLERAQNSYDTHKAQYAVGSQARLDLDSALADLKNADRLHGVGQVSDSEFDKDKRLVEGIKQRLALEAVDRESQLKSDEVAIKETRLTKGKMTLTAPLPRGHLGGRRRPARRAGFRRRPDRAPHHDHAAPSRPGSARRTSRGSPSATGRRPLPQQRQDVRRQGQQDPARRRPRRAAVCRLAHRGHSRGSEAGRGQRGPDRRGDPRPMAILAAPGGRGDEGPGRRRRAGGSCARSRPAFTGINKAGEFSRTEGEAQVIAEDLDLFNPGDRVRTEVLAN